MKLNEEKTMKNCQTFKTKLLFVLAAPAFCVLLAGTIASCKSRKFQTDSVVRGSAIGKVIAFSTSVSGYGSAQGTLTGTGDVEFEISIKENSGKELLSQIYVSLSNPADYDYFVKNPASHSATVRLTRAGTVTNLVDKGTITSGEDTWTGQAYFPLLKDDVLNVTFHDLPATYTGFRAYASIQVAQRDSKLRVSDDLADPDYPSFSANETSTVSEKTYSRTTDIANLPKGLHKVRSYLNLKSPSFLKSGQGYWIYNDKKGTTGSECGEQDPSVQNTFAFTESGSLKPYPMPPPALAPTQTPNPCAQPSQFAVLAEEAGPSQFVTNVSGLDSPANSLSRGHGIDPVDLKDAKPLGAKTTPLALLQANSRQTQQFFGTVNSDTLEFTLSGVRAKTGLVLNSSTFEWWFPVNLGAAPKDLDPKQFTAKLKDSKGEVVKDTAGAEIGVLALSYSEEDSASFSELSLPDIPDGDYVLEIGLPKNFPKGTRIKASIEAEELQSFVGVLDPAVLKDFKDRDAKTGAKVKEWVRPNYDATQDKTPTEHVSLVGALKAMEEVRDAFHTSINDINPITGKPPKKKTKLNTVDFGTVLGCLNTSPYPYHWNDLQHHYYCLHSELRGCYTGVIRETGPEIKEISDEVRASGLNSENEILGTISCRLPTMPVGPVDIAPVLPFDPSFRFPTLREYAYYKCSNPNAHKDPNTTRPSNMLKGCFANSNNFSYVPQESVNKEFGWVNKKDDRKAAFRYLMMASLYAFDEKDQADVINAFWRVKNPADTNECISKRPTRTNDPTDGTHCLPVGTGAAGTGTKKMNPELEPAGR